ncbi:MAG TPA: plastocyanin/azurin family copper-binding protein [Candidatus Baltobacteraceae bacterium]|nr:plastocyanin/azurin family copper-binding protein [Candidatus Baltobacteraceae bacterium]
MTRRAVLALALLALGGCTAGGIPASPGGGGASIAQITKIDVSLAAFPLQNTSAGPALGYSPEVTTVSVGSGVEFVNVDNTSHTATAIAGATAFPATTPFSASAVDASATTDVSGAWSSGTLQPGASSQVFLIDRTGTYYYGCFFHYSGNMRGIIVAQ